MGILLINKRPFIYLNEADKAAATAELDHSWISSFNRCL